MTAVIIDPADQALADVVATHGALEEAKRAQHNARAAKIAAAIEAGVSVSEMADELGVTRATVYKWREVI